MYLHGICVNFHPFAVCPVYVCKLENLVHLFMLNTHAYMYIHKHTYQGHRKGGGPWGLDDIYEYIYTVNVEIFAQYIFLRISRRALDARKF